MKLKSVLTTGCIVCSLICLPSFLQAQGGPGDPGGDPDPDPVGIPFDGGLTLLVAAGIGYSVKRAYDKRKMDKATSKPERDEV